MDSITKQRLYEWFSERPIKFPADHRLLEIFLIAHFDESKGFVHMSKASIRKSTGFSKYLVNRYIDGLNDSKTWVVTRVGSTHTYRFSPQIALKEN